MKKKYFSLVLLLSGMFYLSCERPPEFPDQPKIEFVKVEFGETNIISRQDSLNITISFEDGDGNLGISSEETQAPPFHEATYFLADPPHDPIYSLNGLSTTEALLKYGDLDTLPPYIPTTVRGEDCKNYRIFDRELANNQTTRDTVYMQLNPRNKNFLLDFFIKKDGGFEEFSFTEETCIPSDGTFNKLNTSDHSRPLQGTLTYSFRAANMRQYFGDNVIKLQVRIIDKAENISNMVESPEFTLDKVLIQ